MRTKAINEATVKFPSKSVNEAFARSVTATFAAQFDPTLDELGDIKTAISEAVTNCIVHAYPEQLGTVTLKLRNMGNGILDITVKDEGKGIEDIEQARQPMFSTGGEERSGMGITIMESFMSDVRIKSRPGKGTTVHMRKKIICRGERA